MAPRNNNANVIDTCTKRLTALKTYVDSKAQIAINGKKHKLADVLAIYQSCLDSRAALATKRAETRTAMGTRASAEQARRQADQALKAWVTSEFGIESTEALDFGFPPPRTTTLTVAAKANAVARAQATRAARHTMGKKQKESIRGTLVVPTAPAAPANTVVGASPTPSPATTVVGPPTPAPQPTLNGAATPAASLNGAAGH